MKSIFYKLNFLVILLVCFHQAAKAQANTALSNLSATAINTDLLPTADNVQILGSAVKGWKQLYISNAVFMGGSKFISYGNTLSLGITAVGNNALAANSYGFANTGIGFFSLAANTGGNSNAAIGTRSLQANTTGSANMAMGYFSLFSNTTGYSNVAIGVRAMMTTTADHNQIAIGDSSLFTTNGGAGFNTAIGSKAMYSNTTGSYNTANGYKTLNANTTGYYNTAIGSSALRANTTAYGNTAVGNQSMFTNTTGGNNAAYGAYSLLFNTTGSVNTADGFEALYTNTTGSNNTASGAVAMIFNTTGGNNSATGLNALANNTTGNDNTGMGFQSLFDNTTGSSNTGVGEYSLYTNFTGSFNTAIGNGADVNADALSNATAVGYTAVATASNQVMLGNTSVTAVMAAGSFTIYSDGRFKKDIKADVPGLDFIKDLRPVTYHYNIHGINDHLGKTKPASRQISIHGESSFQAPASNSLEEAAITTKEKKLYTGFVAQEVEKTANKFNYDFSGLYKPQSEKDLYGLSYSDFVVPLVKAVQDLSDSNDDKNQKIAAQDAKIDSLEAGLQQLKALVSQLIQGPSSGLFLSDASLGQNTPNPFTGSTNINYSLPQNFGRAKLMVTDISGRIIKTVMINGTGRGNLNIDASGLSSGVYNYTLYVDEKMISSKQMVLTK